MAVTMSAHSASHADEALMFFGKTNDIKPGEVGSTYPAPPNGSLFYEMDGANRYWMYDTDEQVWAVQTNITPLLKTYLNT